MLQRDFVSRYVLLLLVIGMHNTSLDDEVGDVGSQIYGLGPNLAADELSSPAG